MKLFYATASHSVFALWVVEPAWNRLRARGHGVLAGVVCSEGGGGLRLRGGAHAMPLTRQSMSHISSYFMVPSPAHSLSHPLNQDINGQTIHGFMPESGEHFAIKTNEPTGTIVPTTDPTKILVATQRDILVVDVPGRRVTEQAVATTPESHGTGESP